MKGLGTGLAHGLASFSVAAARPRPRALLRWGRGTVAQLPAPAGYAAAVAAPGSGWRVDMRTWRAAWLSGSTQQEFLTERNVALLREAYEGIGTDGFDDGAARELISRRHRDPRPPGGARPADLPRPRGRAAGARSPATRASRSSTWHRPDMIGVGEPATSSSC